MTQETNDVVGRLQYEADLNRTHPTPARQACVDGLVLIQSQSARIAELEGLIRECRLADAYAGRTGDEGRWDQAFHELCRAERRISLTKDSTSG